MANGNKAALGSFVAPTKSVLVMIANSVLIPKVSKDIDSQESVRVYGGNVVSRFVDKFGTAIASEMKC